VFAILHNLETSDLPFMTAEQRLAFFNDPCAAILRLDDANLDALYALVQSKQPARYREAAAQAKLRGGKVCAVSS
jgi:hypothetical protein